LLLKCPKQGLPVTYPVSAKVKSALDMRDQFLGADR